MYEAIGRPLQLGSLRLKNRIVFAPTSLGLAGPEQEEMLRRIAAGGCALAWIGDVPVEKRGAACRFLARANSRLALGCLEMDLRDGETQARSVICGGGRVPGPEEIDAHMQTCVRALDRCGEGLLRLLRGEMDERQAFALCFAR